jgi:hypothetical protein
MIQTIMVIKILTKFGLIVDCYDPPILEKAEQKLCIYTLTLPKFPHLNIFDYKSKPS